MNLAYMIRVLLAKREMNQKQLAQKLGTTEGNISNKLTRNNFTVRDMEKIANALDCDLELRFIDRNTGEPM